MGGYFGARLAQAGYPVHLIARGRHLAAIRRSGLRVQSPLGNVSVRLAATADPAQVGPVDYVLFAVKQYDTEPAAAALGPLIGPSTTVLPLQNGIDSMTLLARAVGAHAVLGGVAYLFTAIQGAGVIRHHNTTARIVLGEADGRRSTRAVDLVRVLTSAGIDAVLSERIESDIWTKFVFLSAMSALAGLSGAPVGRIVGDPAGRALFRSAMEETIAVARGKAIPLAPDLVEQHLAFADALPADSKPSLLHDREAGKPTEVAGLSGAVVRESGLLRIATPIHLAAATLIPLSPPLAARQPVRRPRAKRKAAPRTRTRKAPRADG